ncbi:hypothetical protein Bhyg_07161 [Pseudolycoriella hygida]|uniref:Uncharacterized protein n=1 Tax=Pseudolycoriella hygida TaxID=35572 RepID=A0A9Q0N239_9DIPT|nr:hypothetical protein Bhyg_07161 [Pseudolycoriella hygida]
MKCRYSMATAQMSDQMIFSSKFRWTNFASESRRYPAGSEFVKFLMGKKSAINAPAGPRYLQLLMGS